LRGLVTSLDLAADNSKGATILECAIVYPLVFLRFFAIIDGGLLLLKHTIASNALYVAGRQAATLTENCEATARRTFEERMASFVDPSRIEDFSVRTITLPNGVPAIRVFGDVALPCVTCSFFFGGAMRFNKAADFSLENPNTCGS
jgi:hypothetical protein